ncbi:MAG: molybdopterin-guanine dinucleotide biosynthesis protein B [Candidatus Cloacimonetes bacterium]|nr:molybdopterin-guanine dinucleotide biosynthesis protein B [Candidatus Cloacimonadota bacterium]
MKVFSVAGYHHTGKTTLVVNLLKELKRRGYKVASVKDIHFEDFTMEKEGSNSQKHLAASDNTVFTRGLNETCQLWNRQLSINEMLSRLDSEYVIVEGMKDSPLPKILCAKDEDQLEELYDWTVFAISGNYAEKHSHYQGIPTFSTSQNIEKITDYIEEKVFRVLPFAKGGECGLCGATCREITEKILSGEASRDACKIELHKEISLNVDGKEIEMAPFVRDILNGTVTGFVRNLKGCETGKVEIVIKD